MPNNKNTHKSIELPIAQIIFIIASFALAVIDMFFLYQTLGKMLHLSSAASMLIAFLFATVANFNALMWGWRSGRHSEQRSINKHSASSFIFWVFIGLFYIGIRMRQLFDGLANATNGVEAIIWNNVLEMVILAIFYIGTGLTISSSAREIWDADAHNCRIAKKKFENLHEDMSEELADIKASIGKLKSYDLNYQTLKRQRAKIEASIYKAEDAAMSDIVGKVLYQHPNTNPKDARIVKQEVLDRRKKYEQEI